MFAAVEEKLRSFTRVIKAILQRTNTFCLHSLNPHNYLAKISLLRFCENSLQNRFNMDHEAFDFVLIAQPNYC